MFRIPYTLGPARFALSKACPGYSVRINQDVRQAVAFLGFGPAGAFTAVGTGFFIEKEGYLHLVTAKHVALTIGDVPFTLRYTRINGENTVASMDPDEGDRWFFHPDNAVDVAVMPIGDGPYGLRYIDETLLISDSVIQDQIGVATETFTVGLFKLLAGRGKNLPVVHIGSIALMPDDERIPVRDWDGTATAKEIEAYLVEQISLGGLSGAPVFVRGLPTEDIGTTKLGLLGLWHGAWDALPGDVLALDHGKEVRVPVGMGVVVPAKKIREVLDSPELEARRDEDRARSAMNSLPAPDVAAFDSPPSTDGDEVLRRMLNTPPKVD